MRSSAETRDRIPLADPELGPEAIERVTTHLESGQLAAGEAVDEFESEFASFAGADHGVATANGTAALHAALESVGIGDGDRVVTTPFSFVASANAIRFTGATPVFADIDPATFTLDPDAVERRIAEVDGTVDAILAVHLYGLPAAVERFEAIADDHDIPLVIDAAQAHGAAFDTVPAGCHGDVACFSFYPTKNMTTGEGGMITTDDPDIAATASRFINHGRDRAGYEHLDLGHNFRLTNMGAAIGRAQLQKLSSFNERRREHAARYNRLLEDTALMTPTEPDDRRHVYHQYTVRCGNRDVVADVLDEHGVDTGVYYPIPIHEQPTFDDRTQSYPVAETVADQVLSLPVHPGVDTAEIEYVARVLTEEAPIEDV